MTTRSARPLVQDCLRFRRLESEPTLVAGAIHQSGGGGRGRMRKPRRCITPGWLAEGGLLRGWLWGTQPPLTCAGGVQESEVCIGKQAAAAAAREERHENSFQPL